MNRPDPTAIAICAGLVGLVAWSFALLALSHAFAGPGSVIAKPVALFVALQAGAGVLYLVVLTMLRRRPSLRHITLFIIAAGLLMRFAQLPATPILEDDFYRYLWDGAVVAHGNSPYAHAPQQIAQRDASVPDELLELADRSGSVITEINHPGLRTIYPPTAQTFFTVAYWISPFDIRGLRAVWLGLDLAVLALLMVMHRTSAHRPFALAVYWLNPLLIKEVFNAGHMELVLVLAMLATFVLAQRGRHWASGLMLGLATGAKLWPALWLPLLLRAGPRSWRSAAGVTTLFALTVALFALPIVLARLDPSSGFTAYAQRWQMNDSAYLIIHAAAELLTADHAQQLARATVAAILLAIMAYLLWQSPAGPDPLIRNTTILTAALFLLSPTQFPWYYLWLLPLLTFQPLWSLLALTVVLPAYYLRFYFDAIEHAAWYDYGVVWIEFVPIWLWLAWELVRLQRQRRGIEAKKEDTPCIADIA